MDQSHWFCPGGIVDAYRRLMNTHPWLNGRETDIGYLLGECRSYTERALVLRMLEEFVYVDQQQLEAALCKMTVRIVDVWNLNAGNAVIVASAKGGDIDGSQLLVSLLKPKLNEYTDSKYKYLNRFTNVLKQRVAKENIVIVDDFMGSGTVLNQRINEIVALERQTGCTFNKFFVTVAATSFSMRRFDAEIVRVYAPIKIKRGIRDAFRGTRRLAAYQSMLGLESGLHKAGEPDCFPFGYGRAEALYCLGLYKNIPNSVFPLLWIDKYGNGKKRKALFRRA